AREAVPEVHDRTQLPGVDHFLQLLDRRLEAVAETDGEEDAGLLDGLGDRLGVFQGASQRLLAQHGNAGLGRRNRQVLVEEGRRADADNIDLAAPDHLDAVVEPLAAVLGDGRLERRRNGVGERDRRYTDRLPGRDMRPADSAETDYPYSRFP